MEPLPLREECSYVSVMLNCNPCEVRAEVLFYLLYTFTVSLHSRFPKTAANKSFNLKLLPRGSDAACIQNSRQSAVAVRILKRGAELALS